MEISDVKRKMLYQYHGITQKVILKFKFLSLMKFFNRQNANVRKYLWKANLDITDEIRIYSVTSAA